MLLRLTKVGIVANAVTGCLQSFVEKKKSEKIRKLQETLRPPYYSENCQARNRLDVEQWEGTRSRPHSRESTDSIAAPADDGENIEIQFNLWYHSKGEK